MPTYTGDFTPNEKRDAFKNFDGEILKKINKVYSLGIARGYLECIQKISNRDNGDWLEYQRQLVYIGQQKEKTYTELYFLIN